MNVKRGLLAIVQVAILMAINQLGYAFAGFIDIPLPGNMLGMVLLFALLASGIIRLHWVEAGATLLLKHLAFFFVPIAVGLMSMGDLLLESGMALLFVLLASAAVGIVLAGGVTQLLARLGKEKRISKVAVERVTP